MHNILLGVVKHHTELLLSQSNESYYIGSPKFVSVIDKRLMKISVPALISRTPRTIKERKLWKASEWRSWLLFYSQFCLKDILSAKYLRHLGNNKKS